MSKTSLVLIVVAVIASIGFFVAIGISNTEKRLRILTEQQEKVCKANFDKMFKVISQVAQVAERNMEASKEAFKEIYPALMEGRYSNDRGGALMSWVTEQNPQFDMQATSKLYEKLANAIEANRTEYFKMQEKLIDFQRAHREYIAVFPNSIIVGSRGDVEITVITSSKTEAVYESAKEDDISVF